MRIENEILKFSPEFKPTQLKLTPLQAQYLPVLMNNSSIESTVDFFLKQGWLVSFRELYGLVSDLASSRSLQNKSILTYFEKLKPVSDTSFFAKLLPFAGRETPRRDLQTLKTLPFFRSLEPELADFLLLKARFLKVPAKSFICRTGDKTRDLFVLISGQAGIYKNLGEKQRQLVAQISENAVFGEASFLLGEARTADIVTFEESELLVVPCLPEIFEKHIDKNKVQGLQFRFWVQQALQKSELFKNFPADCLDALSFSGRLSKVPIHRQLFVEGNPGQTAYVVIQGSVVISQKGQAINVMGQGSFFGEISLLVSGGVRTASAHTQQESLLVEIQQGEFYRLLSQNLFLAKELESLAHQRLLKDQSR